MDEPAVEKTGLRDEDDSPTISKPRDAWWRTSLLWLACFTVGYSACHALGTLTLSWYYDIQTDQLRQLAFWQQCLPYAFGQAGGDLVWRGFRRWRGN